MKRLLLIVLPLLLIVGCEKEPINYETTLVERDGVFYTKDTNKPYSGQVFSLYDDGEKKREGNLKDGKLDGLWTYWYENGQKKWEGTFKDGEYYSLVNYWDENGEIKIKDGNGLWTSWYKNGHKKEEGTYKNGKQDGLFTFWYENGQKASEETWKDEKYTRKAWNEDGSVKE